MTTTRTFFLGWQDQQNSRRWYPVGRLDFNSTDHTFAFGYTKGAREAAGKSGFEALDDFPDLNQIYRSPNLFPMFKNRVMTSQRRSFQDYLKQLAIEHSDPDPMEILAVDGGYRTTDLFQVFPKIEKRENGAFRCRFFLHGWRHTNDAAQARLQQLQAEEPLYVTIELTNPATQLAVQIQSEDYHTLGWAPRYLVGDLVHAIASSPGDYAAQVIRINPMPAPSKQRVLIELSGHWPVEYEPMSTPEFELLGHE